MPPNFVLFPRFFCGDRRISYSLGMYRLCFQLTTMIMSIVILCVIAILLYGVISLMQKYYLKRYS